MTENKPGHSPDDVDLIALLERIYLFLRRFRKAFLVAIVAGIILGCIGYFVSPKIYQSKVILHPSYLTNQEEIEIIDYWNQLLQRNERKVLAPILNCTDDLLRQVISLEGVQIQKNYSSTDPNGFYITALVRNNSVLPDLQKSIIYGLDNTDYVRQKILEKRQDLEQLISKTTIEIGRLDSVKRSIEDPGARKDPAPRVVNVEAINRDRMDLSEKLLNYQNELQSLSSLQVLQSFIPLNTPVSRSLKTSIVLGLILCVAVAYLYSLLKYVEDRLKKRVRT